MIEKMDMKSMDITEENVKKIQALFPSAVTEVIVDGKTTLKIDFDVLKQELSASLIEDKQERYQMTWPDKSKAKVLANSRITSTLRPDKEKSVDFDNTQNLYIEGDNLDVLKLLRETYLGKVKMIYIDPPYNTGHDFVYEDNFSESYEEYMSYSGQYDEQGNRLVRNLDSNGRFHTAWLNMIYPRLKIARDLLSDDGAIFISIDDNELHNLMKICDEIFGESNFVGCICRATGTTTGQDANKIGSSLDYCLVYSKTNDFELNGLDMEEKDLKRFNEKDERGLYSTLQLRKTGNADTREERPNMFYPVIAPDGSEVYPFGPTGYLSRWRVGKDSYKKLLADNMIVWKKQDTDEVVEIDGFVKSKWVPYVKYYLEGRTKQVSNLFQDIEGNKKASIVLKELLGSKGIFDNPKPVEFLEILLQIATNPNDLIVDFFSGSATTAHAIIKYNEKNNSNRKYIMVQLPEECDEKSEAYKAGYKTICEIGEERIRRAGLKIVLDLMPELQGEGSDYHISLMNNILSAKDPFDYVVKNGLIDEVLEEFKGYQDVGFRVLKLDSSNMQDVYYNPMAMRQSLLDETIDNVKSDRTPLDLLFQVMLDLGKDLSAKIEEKQVNGKTYFVVNGNDLIACFDEDIDNSVITEIAKQQPLYAVFKSTSFATDSASINNEQLFKTYSYSTKIMVI